MEEKINNESDHFKIYIRKKIVDEPMSSDSDQQIWDKVMKDIHVTSKPQTKVRSLYWYAAAAIVLIGLTITYKLSNKESDTQKFVVDNIHHTQESPTVKNNEETLKTQTNIRTPSQNEGKSPKTSEQANDRLEVIYAKENIVGHRLPDGSLVTINAGSHITTTLSFENSREVSIAGEAYFEVEPDKSKPFIVHFDTYKLEVVGTKFNVRSIDTESIKEITVTEGVVKVFENKGTSILVKAGEQLKLQNSKAHILTHVEAINFVSWKTNVLNFKSSKLVDVTEILSRIHHCEIRVDSHIKDCIFSGDLSELKLDEALEVLKLASNLKIETKHHKVYITGHGCD
jgi:transmembrane sensor